MPSFNEVVSALEKNLVGSKFIIMPIIRTQRLHPILLWYLVLILNVGVMLLCCGGISFWEGVGQDWLFLELSTWAKLVRGWLRNASHVSKKACHNFCPDELMSCLWLNKRQSQIRSWLPSGDVNSEGNAPGQTRGFKIIRLSKLNFDSWNPRVSTPERPRVYGLYVLAEGSYMSLDCIFGDSGVPWLCWSFKCFKTEPLEQARVAPVWWICAVRVGIRNM